MQFKTKGHNYNLKQLITEMILAFPHLLPIKKQSKHFLNVCRVNSKSFYFYILKIKNSSENKYCTLLLVCYNKKDDQSIVIKMCALFKHVTFLTTNHQK